MEGIIQEILNENYLMVIMNKTHYMKFWINT